jgi:hypothetical protein
MSMFTSCFVRCCSRASACQAEAAKAGEAGAHVAQQRGYKGMDSKQSLQEA